MKEIAAILEQHIDVIAAVKKDLMPAIEKLANYCNEALCSKHTIYFMGNGGSAADSQHLAAEFVGRFLTERRGLSAVALTTDTSILTAVGNDYGFQQVFVRQVQALVRAGDVVIGLSASGNSPNVVLAMEEAVRCGAVTIALTGQNSCKLDDLCDLCIHVPSDTTARIQEAHILIGHILCALLDGDKNNV